MRYCSYLIAVAGALLVLYTSCSNEDDDKLLAGTSGNLWKPDVEVVITSPTSVQLKWSQPLQGYFLNTLLPDIAPTDFRIFMSEQFTTGYKEVAEIKNREDNYSFSMDGLQENTPCYFYITGLRKGIAPIHSDTLMVIPAKGPEQEVLFVKNDIRQLAYSPELNKLAYIDPFYKWVEEKENYSTPAILMSNLDGTATELLVLNGTYPCWSATGNIVYFTQLNSNKTTGAVEEQLAQYSIEDQETTLLKDDNYSRWGSKYQPLAHRLLYQVSAQVQENNYPLSKLTVLDLESMQEKDVVDESFLYLRSVNKLTWRDTDRFLFDCLSDHKDYQIYEGHVSDGTVRLLLPGEWSGMAPSVSPTGTYMAFIGNRTGSSQIWVYNFAGNSFRMLTGYTENEYILPGTTTIEWYDESSILFVSSGERVVRVAVN